MLANSKNTVAMPIRRWHIRSVSTKLIERQLADLQKRVTTLEAKVERTPRGRWRDLIGWEKDDELFREAVRAGAAWRAKANLEGK